MKRLLILWTLALAAMAAFAAPDAAGDTVAPSFRHPAAGALVLLLLEKTTEPPLAAGNAMLLSQVQRQLASAGYRTAVLDYADYQLLAVEEARATGEHDRDGRLVVGLLARQRALSRLARIAADSSHCDLVVRARFVFRPAPIVGGLYAEWDGGRHGLLFENSNVLPSDEDGTRTLFAGASGTSVGLSVELMAYDAAGTHAFTTHGAVAIPYVTNAARSSNRWRTDLFDSDADVADGVRIALAPLR